MTDNTTNTPSAHHHSDWEGTQSPTAVQIRYFEDLWFSYALEILDQAHHDVADAVFAVISLDDVPEPRTLTAAAFGIDVLRGKTHVPVSLAFARRRMAVQIVDEASDELERIRSAHCVDPNAYVASVQALIAGMDRRDEEAS